ncbi:MAG: LysR family transcriptional regulator [Candidatus Metalachnospira sp.]|nr:LysR family transcriptional regulator [Candidatus Metalachnospira sp.]
MEIRNLRTFSKIAELGSFTKAAKFLGYAQSTLTFHIQEIETHYGLPVFEKIGKHIYLTSFGKELLEQVKVVLQEYDMIEQLGNTGSAPQGRIRIGAPESLMMYRLYPIIKAYKSAYPQVEISVINDPCELLREHLLEGQLDLSFLLQPVYNYPNLNVCLLHEETMCLVAPADHKQEDFLPDAAQMILYTEKECTYRQEFDRYLLRHQYLPSNVLETASVEAIKKYVINGLGVSYLPYYSVKEEADKGLLLIKFAETDMRFFTQIVYHKNKWLSPALKTFIDFCNEYSKKWD